MLTRRVLELFDLLDSPFSSGEEIKKYLESIGEAKIQVIPLGQGEKTTDCIKILIPGVNGKKKGGTAPTLGILGRLGGIGARPEIIGYVSDGDGCLAALAAAAKLIDMKSKGDSVIGDVLIATDINPNAPTQPHDPVPFMGSSVDIQTVNQAEIDESVDAILCIDTTKGNRIINHNGVAISPTVKEGYILRVSEDLLNILEVVTGCAPNVFAISQQDITPYGNDIYHINSIMQPCTNTSAPVVGVAITAQAMIPGCATGASRCEDVETAARFAVEVAKYYTAGKCHFFDDNEYKKIVSKYGKMNQFQTKGIE